ncbi:MAG: hypothetical protein ACR2L2_01790 [Acidobacteriota bacterium]
MNGPFDWFTISYRALKFWSILALIGVVGLVGWNYRASLPGLGGLNPSPPPREATTKRTGQFSRVNGQVTVRKVDTMNEVPAGRITELEEGDMIITGSNGSAEIILFDGSKFEVRPGTIAVLSQARENTATQERSTSLTIDDGETLVSTGQKNVRSSTTKVITQKAGVAYGAHTQGGASYNKAKGLMEIYLYSGEAEATTNDGAKSEKIKLKAEESVRVGSDKKFLEKEKLPPVPVLTAPPNNQSYETKQVASLKVKLEWQPIAGIPRYRVQVSDTPNFYTTLRQEVVEKPTFLLGGLKHDVYFWRVTAINEKGVEGQSSLVSRIVVIQELKSSDINLRVIETKSFGDTATGAVYQVKGRTDPGVRVRFAGEEVLVNGDGSFSHVSKPIRGATGLLEGFDLSGNTKRLTVKLTR